MGAGGSAMAVAGLSPMVEGSVWRRGAVSVDLTLVAKRVERGDASAFREIVTQTEGRLYRLAMRMMADAASAEDVLQDTYVKAFRAIRDGRYDGTSKVSTWLHRILTNSCIDALRKRREHASGNVPEPHYDGAVTADARLALLEIERWLGELPPSQRVVVVLRLLEGMSALEVAKILECSETAVEQRLVRARAALRERRDKAEGR